MKFGAGISSADVFINEAAARTHWNPGGVVLRQRWVRDITAGMAMTVATVNTPNARSV